MTLIRAGMIVTALVAIGAGAAAQEREPQYLAILFVPLHGRPPGLRQPPVVVT